MAKKETFAGIEFSKMRWVLRGETLHVQIKGKEYNRPYGMSLDIPLANFDKNDFGGLKDAFGCWLRAEATGAVKSRAGTGVDYSRGFIAVGVNRAGQRALLVRYATQENCARPLRTLCGTVCCDVMDWIEQN